ncbi:unnamed protein product (macronuclear) [Paramecium tetraurelia]|uniref:Thioredoxin domain-containing protein n=1 Tax=Paramecium tetraurelia TaxID=5888 RepID=A0D729_PARTE|nr:uncharacterized protein GSPATT00001887001 [Paramecium tetraurelia]CAK78846.1 unnamed protein product [Paramecium tetraurelia]|eukprot:XP_001446243.1 hypothetical protein (macronuclear) [Paramecium tetraurelia strain d4-2]
MFFLFIYCVVAHQFKSDSRILQLNGEQLESELQKSEPFLMMLYAPWCGHCKHLIPVLDQLADQVDYKFIAVDCVANPDAKKRFGIKGYPTLLYVKDNKTHKFQGQRTPELIIKFIQEDYAQSKEISDVPKYEPYQEGFIDKYFNNIWIFIAVIVLSTLTIVVTFLCINDYKENKKLDQMEKKLQEKKK